MTNDKTTDKKTKDTTAAENFKLGLDIAKKEVADEKKADKKDEKKADKS